MEDVINFFVNLFDSSKLSSFGEVGEFSGISERLLFVNLMFFWILKSSSSPVQSISFISFSSSVSFQNVDLIWFCVSFEIVTEGKVTVDFTTFLGFGWTLTIGGGGGGGGSATGGGAGVGACAAEEGDEEGWISPSDSFLLELGVLVSFSCFCFRLFISVSWSVCIFLISSFKVDISSSFSFFSFCRSSTFFS